MALTDNLLLYLKLDGNSTDASGNGNNGTDTDITYGTGKIIQGAIGDGDSSQISFGTTGFPTGASPWSVSLWYNASGLPASTGTAVFFSYGAPTGLNRIVVGLRNPSGTQLVSINTTASYTFTSTTGVWYHVVATYDGSNLILYHNGVNQASASSVTYTLTNSTLHHLFMVNSALWYYGALDEVAMWARTLTPEEALTIYNGGMGLSYPFGSGNFLSFM